MDRLSLEIVGWNKENRRDNDMIAQKSQRKLVNVLSIHAKIFFFKIL